MITAKDIINVEFIHTDKFKTKPQFYIFKRDENNHKVVEEVKTKFYPYFYVNEEENIGDLPDFVQQQILRVEHWYTSYDGKKLKKIVCQELNRQSFLMLRDYFKVTYEDDVLFRNRFIIDNDITFSKHQRIFYLDIETNLGTNIMKVDKEIISISCYDNLEKRYSCFVWRKDLEEKREKNIFYFNNERSMLISFFKFIQKKSPDVFTGWFVNGFDFPYIIKRTEKIGLRDYNELLSPLYKIKCDKKCYNSLAYSIINEDKEMTYTKIYGVEIVDLLKIYKKLTYDDRPDNYRLNTVAKHVLGDEKLKMNNIQKMWKEDLNSLIKYNLKDVELCVNIDEKCRLLEYFFTVQQIIPIPLEDIFFNSRVVDVLILKKYHNKKIFPSKRKHEKEYLMGAFAGNLKLISNKKHISEIIKSNEPYIKENDKNKIWYANYPNAEIYNNIAVFDFKSLYSNIYRTFNLSPEVITTNGDLEVGEIKIDTSKKGLISQLFEDLLIRRKEVEDARDAVKDRTSAEYYALQNLQGGIKTIANSITGVAGYPSFRLYNPHISRTVMYIARLLLVKIKKLLTDYDIIYVDTDSFFIKLKEENMIKEVEKLQNRINIELNRIIIKEFKLKNNYLQVDCEKIFKKIIFTGVKKAYMGLLSHEKGNIVNKFFVRGLSIVRKDSPQCIKDLLKNIYLKILNSENLFNVRDYMYDEMKKLKKLNYWEIGITKQINKALNDYTTNCQHIRAAKFSNKILGTNFTKSDAPKMLFIKNKECDVIMIDEDTVLPDSAKIDYDKFFNLVIFNKLKMFENIKGLNINILYNKNKNLFEFVK